MFVTYLFDLFAGPSKPNEEVVIAGEGEGTTLVIQMNTDKINLLEVEIYDVCEE